MTSPLQPFTNARLLIEVPGARGGPEVGYKRTGGQQIVLELFMKQVSEKERSEFERLERVGAANDVLKGYVISFADLPDGADWQTYDLAAGTFDSTGKRPSALTKGLKAVALQFGSRVTETVEVIEAAGTFDDLGIGQIVRDVLGDRLILKIEWRR